MGLPTFGHVVSNLFSNLINFHFLFLLSFLSFYFILISKVFLFHLLKERNRLETYEDLSDQSIDLNLFSNLTFQFSCENKPIGLYADVDYDCRIFHACDEDGKGFPMICPNNTVFDQRQRVCSDIVNDCEHAQEW